MTAPRPGGASGGPAEEPLPWWEAERLGYFTGGSFEEYRTHYGYDLPGAGGLGGAPVSVEEDRG